MVWVVYGQTLHHKFVCYDDNVYVYENPVVEKGLTMPGIAWAFTFGKTDYWHPLTWISHMLDCQFYGLEPGGHHLTNVLLHAASAVLLFLVLRQMTGALWRSAFVAAVFAVHPLHVESVAWVSERKDVLSGLFFMLTLWAYAHYVRGPRSPARYLPVVILFAAGLMCKGMLVTLPFLLLLLDLWPLGRLRVEGKQESIFRLVLEKIPLFALSAASCVITSLMPEKVAALNRLAFSLRMENAVASCIIYLRQMVWPADLAVPYPYPAGGFPQGGVIAALALLAAISAAAFVFRKQRPWLAVGWLWYLGMLLPVIGIVQIGTYARADRYTYLPQIGLYIVVTWLAAEACRRLRLPRLVPASLATIILATLIWSARVQASWWKDDYSLWTHTLSVMPGNAVAHNNLGYDLELKGRVDEALDQYRKALLTEPDYPEAHNNLGNALLEKNEQDAAIAEFRKALQIMPDYASAHNNLGNALLQKGEVDDAIVHLQRAVELSPGYVQAENNLGNAMNAKNDVKSAMIHYRKAVDISPGYAPAHVNLANTLLLSGRADEAEIEYRKALDINPGLADAHGNLGNILLEKGMPGEAAAQLQEALKIDPDYPEAENSLAHILATSTQDSLRDGTRALELASRANRSTGDGNPLVLGTLAAAYAENGRFTEAMETAQKAMDIATSRGDARTARSLQEQIALYLKKLPLRDAGSGK